MGDLFIAGTWTTGAADGRREIICPADGAHVGTVTEASDADTRAAIAAHLSATDCPSGGRSGSCASSRR